MADSPKKSEKANWASEWWAKQSNVLSYLQSEVKKHVDKQDEAVSKAFVKNVVEQEIYFKNLDKSLKALPKFSPSKNALKKHKEPTERFLTVFLSDTHYHSLLDPEEVPLTYGPVEEARATSKVAQQICQYKKHYRPFTELNLIFGGDMIQGQLHDARDGAALSDQMAACMHYLASLVKVCSDHFKKVHVKCITGNHGRNKSRHHDRAVLNKWDSHETVIYNGVKMICQNLANVDFDIPKTPYTTLEMFGYKVFATHGDTVLSPGFPGSNINVGKIEAQINKINARLPHNERYNLFIMGHVHVASMVYLSNGSVFITNGALIPPDSYSVSKGIFDTARGATMFETVPDHIVGDYRFIQVDEHTDKDSSLDNIIKPYIGNTRTPWTAKP